MGDCIWFQIARCDSCCKCDRYVSMNSDEGEKLAEQYSKDVDEALLPVWQKYKQLLESENQAGEESR